MNITIVPSMRWIKTDKISLNLPEWDFNDNHIEIIEWKDGEGKIKFKDGIILENTINDISILNQYLERLNYYSENNFPDVVFDEKIKNYVLKDKSKIFHQSDNCFLSKILLSNDNLDEKFKSWIYIHIPKTAGMFIKSRIKESLETSKILDPFVDNDLFSIPIKNAPSISFVKKNIELSNDERVGFIVVVRNPYDRIYSLWKWSRVNGIPGNLEFPEVEEKFNDFVISLTEGNYDHYYFMQRQTFFIKGYDTRLKIMKFEDLNTDVKAFFQKNGVSWSYDKINDIPGKKYTDVYNKFSIKAVQKRCEEEFEVFDYSMEF
jgi:hypothetical protein